MHLDINCSLIACSAVQWLRCSASQGQQGHTPPGARDEEVSATEVLFPGPPSRPQPPQTPWGQSQAVFCDTRDLHTAAAAVLFSVGKWLTMPLVEQVVSALVKNDAAASHVWTRREYNAVYRGGVSDQTDMLAAIVNLLKISHCIEDMKPCTSVKQRPLQAFLFCVSRCSAA